LTLAHSLIQEADQLLADHKEAREIEEWLHLAKALARTGADLLE
jgi:hypothetical protein